MARNVNFYPLIKSSTNDEAPLDNKFGRKFTTDPLADRMPSQTSQERANAKRETAHGERPVQYPEGTIMNTKENAKEKTGMRYKLGGGKRKSRGKRTKKGK